MKKNDAVFYALTHAAALIAGFIIAMCLARVSLIRLTGGVPAAADKLSQAAEIIDTYYIGSHDPDWMRDEAIRAMVESLGDKWSYYLTQQELDDYMLASHNSQNGLGIVLQKDGDRVVVAEVYEDSPAKAAGLEPGCAVTAVNGLDMTKLPYADVIAAIREGIDTDAGVTLTVIGADGKAKDVEITVGSFNIDPVEYEMLDGSVGLIRIKNFEDRCSEQTIGAIDALRGMGAEGLIFDVRNNPGGQYDELIPVLDHILPEGRIFYGRDVFGNESTEMSDAQCVEMPMAVLVNSLSYSAAEYFAAALWEFDRAVTVGEKTPGKGYAQVTFPLTGGDAVHLSAIEYFTPKGNSLADTGLAPDVTVEMSAEDTLSLFYGILDRSDDVQLEKAVELLAAEIRNNSSFS